MPNEDYDFFGPLLAAITAFPAVPRFVGRGGGGRSRRVDDLIKREIEERGSDPNLFLNPVYRRDPTSRFLAGYDDMSSHKGRDFFGSFKDAEGDANLADLMSPEITYRDAGFDPKSLRHEVTHYGDFTRGYDDLFNNPEVRRRALEYHGKYGKDSPLDPNNMYARFGGTGPFQADKENYWMNPFEMRARYFQHSEDPMRYPLEIGPDFDVHAMYDAIYGSPSHIDDLLYGRSIPGPSQIDSSGTREMIAKYLRNALPGEVNTLSFPDERRELDYALGF